MHLEDDLDAERGSLLDGEGLVLERLQGTGGGELNDHVGAALDLEGEGLDDTLAGVVGVSDGGSGVQTKGGLPAVEGLVVLVWGAAILACLFAPWAD